MPPRSSKGKAPVVPVTKGKKNTVPESDDEEHDLQVQEELLIRKKATPERFSFTERSSKKAPAETPKKKKKRSFHDLQGFGDLSRTRRRTRYKYFDKKKEKDAHAHIVAAVHQQGPKTGQPTGNMYFAIHIPFGENEPFKALVSKVAHVERPNFFEEQKEWAVKVPTKEVALRLFESIKTSPKMRKTSSQLNLELDVSPFDKVKRPHFTLATSATQFETRNDGILPRSIMIVGNAFDFKEFLKAKF
ncbi:hypothetical protein Ctob_016484, partial [Chrysochromulina tobinii]